MPWLDVCQCRRQGRDQVLNKPSPTQLALDLLGTPKVYRQISSAYNIPSKRVPIPDRQWLHTPSHASHRD